MIQLVLLLLGTKYIKRNALYLSVAGIIWMVCGLLIFIDGLDNHPYFPLKTFGCILLLESLLTLSVMSSVEGTKKSILFFKGGIFFLVALLILVGKTYSNLLLALIFAFSFFLIGFFTTLSSFVVRYPHWKKALFYGLSLMLFSLFLLLHHAAAISFFIGLQLIVSGLSCVGIARKTWRMENGTSIFQLIQPGDVLLSYVPLREGKGAAPVAESKKRNTTPLIVHIWTPEESAATQPVPRPIINRYIAAVDADGVISTGHAAL